MSDARKPSGDGRELLLLDVYSLVYRAYFALPPLTTSTGMPTNAVYGFERMLNRVINDERPTHIAACFDAGIPKERFEAVPEYKAQRPEMPGDLAPQFDSVRRALEAYGIPAIAVEGEEADDCIATLATRASRDGLATLIVSGDLDLLQLVDERTTLLVTRRGISEMARYDPAAVRERFGLDPMQLPDYKALKGDPSDNLPGVPGVGEKTATKLIARYGTLDGLLEHVAEVTPKRIADLIAAHADQARRCRQVSIAKRDLPIAIEWDAVRYEAPPREQLAAFYAAFEFKTLLSRFNTNGQLGTPASSAVPPADPVPVEEIPTRYRTLDDPKAASEEIARLRAVPMVAIALIPGGADRSQAAGMAFCGSAGEAFVVPQDVLVRQSDTVAALDSLIAETEPAKSVHDLKSLHAWTAHHGRRLNGVTMDTMLAAGLVDPNLGEPTIAEAARLAGASLTVVDAPPSGQAMDLFAAPAALDPVLASAADAIFRATPRLAQMLEEAGETALLRDVELPLTRVIADMQSCGFALDAAELDRIRAELDAMIAATSAEIYTAAGEEFNLNSPKALGSILFEKLALPGAVKKKTGYATGLEVLAPLALEHPIAAKMLEYREVAKLKSTYVDALPALIDNGRVHTTLHQLGAATGRLSSTNPNLQNIPVRTAAGRAIRRAFVPTRGKVLLAADYSQIELRLFAHLSDDTNLIAAFAAGNDVHAYTARVIFGVPADAPLDPELRRRAKAVNFGILYGMGSFGLAQSAGISRAEARQFIADYFDRFPQVKAYIDRSLAKARTDGYVTTLLGRRRYLPDLRSTNHGLRAAAERMAINAPLQGSAADLIKLAMVRVAPRMQAAAPQAQLLLQVHDELIFEAAPAELEPLRAAVKEAMEGAMSLAVPLVVDFKSGPTWADLE